MMRFLVAFVWFRWRLMANGLKGGRRRDAVDRLARAVAIILPVFVWLVIMLAAIVTAGAGFVLGLLAAKGSLAPKAAFAAPRVVLFMVSVAVVLVPIGRSMHGVSSSMTRFLLLPVPRPVLHAVEVLSGLADPWLAFVIPGLMTLPIGLAAGGRPAAATWAVLLGLGFLAALATLASLLTFLVHWILRDRRRAEVAAILGVVILSTGGALMGMVSHSGMDAGKPTGVTIRIGEEHLPSWTWFIPSELYGRSLQAAWDGAGPAVAGAAVLWAQAMLFFALSAAAHRRILEPPETGPSRRRRGRSRDWRNLPLISPAAGAVAAAQVRAWMRTVRGRLSVYLSGPMLLILGLTVGRVVERLPVGPGAGRGGTMILTAGCLFSLLGLQPILMNQFATDRAGLTLQFLSPITSEDVVRGKAVAGGVLFGISIVLCLAASLVLAPGGSILGWLSSLMATASIYVLMAPLAAMISAVFPKPADLGKIGSAGNAHGAASLIGTILLIPLAAPPGVIVLVADTLLGMPALGFGLMALWMIVAVVIGMTLLGVAARLLDSRRESLVLVAQER